MADKVVGVSNVLMPWTKAVGTDADVGREAGAFTLNTLFTMLAASEDKEAQMLELVVKLAEAKNKTPCLIVDEANAVLRTKDAGDLKALGKIVNETKSKRTMSVILSTSVHAYPDQLQGAIGFQANFVSALYMEELPPSVVWNILTEEEAGDGTKLVGMGERLARLCLAVCGGNLLRLHKLVEALSDSDKGFALAHVFNGLEGTSEIWKYMDEQEEDYQEEHRTIKAADKAKAKEILVALAKQGYWQNTRTANRVVKYLVEDGIASKLSRADVLQESPLFSTDRMDLVLPSSQSLRYFIVSTYPDLFSG